MLYFVLPKLSFKSLLIYCFKSKNARYMFLINCYIFIPLHIFIFDVGIISVRGFRLGWVLHCIALGLCVRFGWLFWC